MPPTNKIWSHRPPLPLPGYPPAAPDPDEVQETGRWFLVSLAGRASLRIRERFVVGSGATCDLSLVEWGISPNHALLTVENGELYITPLSDEPTLVDGQVLRGRRRLGPDSALSFGELEFGVQFEAPEPPRWVVPRSYDSAEASLPPLEPVAAARSPLTAPPLVVPPRSESRPRARPRSRSRNAAPISLGIAVPLVLFALWFSGADQWPARFAENAEPLDQSPVPTPSSAPLDVASNVNGAVRTAPVVAAPAQNEAIPQADQATPVNEATPPIEEAAPPAAERLPPQVAESTPQPTQDSDATGVATFPPEIGDVEPAPERPLLSDEPALVADAQATTAGSERPAEAAMPPAADAAVAGTRPVETALAVHNVAGPPLIFKETPPLVDIEALEMADARVKPPWSDRPPIVADATAKRAVDQRALAALMSEAGRLYGQGDLVTPPHKNAAELYVKVLVVAPKSSAARARLNNIVGWVARDASDALSDHRSAKARQILAQLSTAVPKDRRANIDATAMRRWRVVELLVAADGLMQKRQIVGPSNPNAVALLREALKIDRHNAIAEQMLAKALGLVASSARNR